MLGPMLASKLHASIVRIKNFVLYHPFCFYFLERMKVTKKVALNEGRYGRELRDGFNEDT